MMRKYTNMREKNISLFISINLHITDACNYKCKFCFAHFNYSNGILRFNEWKNIINQLVKSGCQKINFVGGEPILHPDFEKLIEFTSTKGITTTIVTNGSLLNESFIERNHEFMDWIGFSIDSSNETTEIELGRALKSNNASHLHINHILTLIPKLRKYKIKIKVNTVITSLNWYEDMTSLIEEITPDRWKVFQVLPIVGENDDFINDLLVKNEQFDTFIENHKNLYPVVESNEAMTGSYVMIDPKGRFFENTKGKLVCSKPILDIGLESAFEEVQFSLKKLILRDGIYLW